MESIEYRYQLIQSSRDKKYQVLKYLESRSIEHSKKGSFDLGIKKLHENISSKLDKIEMGKHPV
tara:strand:- start:592 stop:783 length:192 start_codon:yes stop_codon:yes gene_type:complete